MGARLYVVMGVAGCGKSLIGSGVAAAIGATYIDGDDFHPAANIAKMSTGQALTDEDRWPWLRKVAQQLAGRDGIVLVGCSALKRAYRDFITSEAGEPVCFLYLEGSKALIAGRMAARSGHFMPTSLLDSQFATLEAPDDNENAIAIDISGTPEQTVALIVQRAFAGSKPRAEASP
jgi:gluconokinase